MADYYSPDRYKQLWKNEVMSSGAHDSLAQIVWNWSDVLKAFDARNRLVHGKDRYTRNMAMPHVEALIEAVEYVDSYCMARSVDLSGRMPVRRKRRVAVRPDE